MKIGVDKKVELRKYINKTTNADKHTVTAAPVRPATYRLLLGEFGAPARGVDLGGHGVELLGAHLGVGGDHVDDVVGVGALLAGLHLAHELERVGWGGCDRREGKERGG